MPEKEKTAAEFDGAKAAHCWTPWLGACTGVLVTEIVRLPRDHRREGGRKPPSVGGQRGSCVCGFRKGDVRADPAAGKRAFSAIAQGQ